MDLVEPTGSVGFHEDEFGPPRVPDKGTTGEHLYRSRHAPSASTLQFKYAPTPPFFLLGVGRRGGLSTVTDKNLPGDANMRLRRPSPYRESDGVGPLV